LFRCQPRPNSDSPVSSSITCYPPSVPAISRLLDSPSMNKYRGSLSCLPFPLVHEPFCPLLFPPFSPPAQPSPPPPYIAPTPSFYEQELTPQVAQEFTPNSPFDTNSRHPSLNFHVLNPRSIRPWLVQCRLLSFKRRLSPDQPVVALACAVSASLFPCFRVPRAFVRCMKGSPLTCNARACGTNGPRDVLRRSLCHTFQYGLFSNITTGSKTLGPRRVFSAPFSILIALDVVLGEF